MRICLLLFSTFFFQYAIAQDTLFIERNVVDTPCPIYHAIFIDTSSTSLFREQITGYSFHRFDSLTYFDGLRCLEKPKQKIPWNQIKDLPRNWVPLFQYKGKYYTYFASDWCCIFRFRITDSTTIDHSVEGPEPSWIEEIRSLGNGHYVVNRTNFWDGHQVDIQLIDPTKGMAVISFGPNKYNKGARLLMVDANRAHLFPTIVNYCPTNRVPELEFDSINFGQLLKNIRQK